MELNTKAIKDFQKLYKKHFGVNINAQTAEVEAKKLLRLVLIIQKDKNVYEQRRSKTV